MGRHVALAGNGLADRVEKEAAAAKTTSLRTLLAGDAEHIF